MEKVRHLLLTVLFFITVCEASANTPVIKVACIGNSITYGATIPNREKNSYPAQLQAYLGDKYEVRNFGSNGTTALSKGDYPYILTDEYKESRDFQPDIVLIKLGTNDTKPQNWKYQQEFVANYQAIIDSYKRLESHPRIILLTPVRCYLPQGSEISAELIENEIRPTVKQLAYDNQLEIINMFNLFSNKWEYHLMPDKLHPSSIGAGIMAKSIYEYLTLPEATPAKVACIPTCMIKLSLSSFRT